VDGLNTEITGTLTELGTIDTEFLEYGFTLAQNLSDDCWITHPDFEISENIKITDRIRSFSMGDVIKKNGKYFICAFVGFEEIENYRN